MSEKFVKVMTRNMGSCWCGHCYCIVYENGLIQYDGNYDWQCSERKEFLMDKEPRRDYDSQLKAADYERAMKAMESKDFQPNYAECDSNAYYTYLQGEK